MNKYKVCIIGLGRIASLLEDDSLREKPCTHAGAVAANPDCELAAGCDIDEQRRRLFAEKWNVPVYADAVKMLREQKPHIAIIATHPDSHYYYCRMIASLASEAGVPVIICEKPLADNLKEARKIAGLSKKDKQDNNKIKIITNHERRYSEDYIMAKNILKEKTLGNILSIRAVLYMGIKKRLIDVFWHDGTHLADAIMFLTDSVLKHRHRWGAKLSLRQGTAWLEGNIYREPHEHNRKSTSKISSVRVRSYSFLRNEFAVKNSNHIPVLIEIGAGRDHLVFEIEFSCEKGRLRIGNGVFEVMQSEKSPYAENFRSLKNTGQGFTGSTGYFSNMVKDAVACVKDPNQKPVSGAYDGLRVIEYLNSAGRWR